MIQICQGILLLEASINQMYHLLVFLNSQLLLEEDLRETYIHFQVFEEMYRMTLLKPPKILYKLKRSNQDIPNL